MSAPEVEIQARSATRDLWLKPDLAEMPDEVMDEVVLGEVSGLTAPLRLSRTGSGTRVGDLVWTSGSFIKIASPRLVAALNAVGATGFHVFDVDLPHEPGGLSGFVGLGVDGAEGRDDLANPGGEPFWSMVISPRLDDALRSAGVDGFERRASN